MNKKLSLFALTGALFLGACGNTSAPTPAPQQPQQPPVTTPGGGEEQAAPAEAYYVMDGVRMPITAEQLQDPAFRSNFVFYAWLEDEEGAIPATDIAAGEGFAFDQLTPGETVGERTETAPIDSQNLAAAFVGFRADDGNVYPVVGANVRWDIAQPSESTIRFATADDGGQPTGAVVSPLDVNDNATSAFTYTNSATLNNVAFPATSDFALNNVTGVNSPDVDGFTWTALWSVGQREESAQISAVGFIGEYEINKTTLAKTFAPSAELEIEKTVISNDGLDDDGMMDGSLGLNEQATIQITVTNTGEAAATNIQLQDRLVGDGAQNYTISNVTTSDGSSVDINDNDDDNDGDFDNGFDATFDLAPGETATFTFNASADATGAYCDVAEITRFDNGVFGTVTNPDLQDDACIVVTSPSLNIVKTLVDADGNIIPSGQEVGIGERVFARITVSNSGDSAATDVVVRDVLTRGDSAAYLVRDIPEGTNIQGGVGGNDGFITTEPFTLQPGEEISYTFNAVANAEGTYCDQGLIDATYNNDGTFQGGSLSQCFVVTAPDLSITKTNTTVRGSEEVSLRPGQSYNSTITVTNDADATGTARNVAVSDLLGNQNGTFVDFGSASFTVTDAAGNPTGVTGSAARNGNTITTVPATVNLAPGESLIFTVTSTVPAGAVAGEDAYCNVASFTSTNGGNGQATDCITVTNFIAEQIQLTDTFDPIVAGGNGTNYTGTFSVELGSNQAADNNVFYFYVGTGDATDEVLGNFLFSNVTVYYDATPERDARTGNITSQPTEGDLVDPSQFVINADGTNTDNGRGQFYVDFNDDFAIQPGGAVFIAFDATAAEGQAPGTYYTNTRWTNTGANTGSTQRPFSSEPTTVVEE